MNLPWWISSPAFGLASLVQLAVGIRYLALGTRVREGTPLILSGRLIHKWWTIIFFPFFLTLPVLWIVWPWAALTIGFTALFGFYFVPYVMGVRKNRYLMGYNFDADSAKQEVMNALSGEHEDLKLDGHRFLAGDKEILRGIFDPPTAWFWISAHDSLGSVKSEIPRSLVERLRQVPRMSGLRSPWYRKGILFCLGSVVFALAALGFSKDAWLPASRDFELIKAAWEGNESRVKTLLAEGADPNTADGSGRRPLHFAAVCGHTELADPLLRAGADIDALDSDGRTPLHHAVLYGKEKVTELLISRGADLQAKTKEGQTPIALARARKNTRMAGLLEKASK